MLHVISLEASVAMLQQRFDRVTEPEEVPLSSAVGRALAEDVAARADVPDFVRSTVDGYAVHAEDTFGCSESIPALLRSMGEVRMGSGAPFSLESGRCVAVPTGGELPAGADAMVMVEDTENFGDGVIAIERPTAPGRHIVFIGDDVHAGDVQLARGVRVREKDIGVLAALGYATVSVRKKPRVTVISTGDELVCVQETPTRAQVRDVNGPMLTAQCAGFGGEAVYAGIVRDDAAALQKAIGDAARDSDIVLLSGGSSVGVRDMAAERIGSLGTVLFHGLSVKPGKPTMCGDIGGTPVFGLPGHPVAAFFICQLLVRPVLMHMLGACTRPSTETARLTQAIPSNHGREEYVAVRLIDGYASPVMGKSGLISTLANADGYVRIPRDTEGLGKDEQVTVVRWEDV